MHKARLWHVASTSTHGRSVICVTKQGNVTQLGNRARGQYQECDAGTNCETEPGLSGYTLKRVLC